MALDERFTPLLERRQALDKERSDERQSKIDKEREAARLRAISEQGVRQYEIDVANGVLPAEALRRNASKIYIGSVSHLPTVLKTPDKFTQVPAVIDGRDVTVNSNTATGRITPINLPREPLQPQKVVPQMVGGSMVQSNTVTGRLTPIPSQPTPTQLNTAEAIANSTNAPASMRARNQALLDANPIPNQPTPPATFLGMNVPTPNAPVQTAAPAGNLPAVGSVIRGYKFLGGNPADKNSWEKVQ